MLCVASLGTGSIVKGALKGVERIAELTKLGNRIETAEHVLKNAITGAERVIETATHYVPTAEHSKLFTTPEKAVGHYAKHEKSIKSVLGKDAYQFGEFMADANHVINEGTYAAEINGYVKIIGGPGKDAKAAVVGLTADRTAITTFHIDKVKDLAIDAPSLGWTR